MKRNLATILIAYVLLLLSCKTEPDYVRDYPQLLSSEIVSNTKTGITVTATISDLLMSRITDHGFVWVQDSPFLSNRTVFTKSLGKPSSTTFSTDITTQLLAGKPYILKAFLKTETVVIYGLEMTFTSLGSEGPVIESMSPLVVEPKDLVTIKGRGFGTDITKTKVAFVTTTNAYNAVIKTLSDAEMVVETPSFIAQTVNVRITVPETAPYTSTISLTRRLPKLLSISSTDICSPITINGENILSLGKEMTIRVNNVVAIPSAVTATSITLPNMYHAPTLNIKIEYPGGYSSTTTFTDPIKFPVVTSTAPSIITQSESFILTGTNFTTQCGAFQLTSSAGDSQMAVTKVTSTEITIKAVVLGCTPFKVSLYYGPTFESAKFLLYASETIEIRSFTVSSITPDHGRPGDRITVKGTGLEGAIGAMGDISINGSGYVDLPMSGTNTTQIAELFAPHRIDDMLTAPDGKTAIHISKCGHSESFTFKIDIPEFTITDFTPKAAGSTMSIMTITGANFPIDYTTVCLLDLTTGEKVYEFTMQQITSTEIKVHLFPQGFIPEGGAFLLAVDWLGRRKVFATPFQM